MQSASGYPGVRRHGHKWQAKDTTGVYGTFADPYEAACALATARGRPLPERRPDSTQQHIASLATALLAVPAGQLLSVLANALVAVEALRAQGTSTDTVTPVEAASVVPTPDPTPAPASASTPTPTSAPTPAPVPTLLPQERRRAKRAKAIADWWRTLWATGETFHLAVERPRLFDHFLAVEQKRLEGKRAEYDAMDGATFTKLLKENINKTDGEYQRRSEGRLRPSMWWEIDGATYCPPELVETWNSQRELRATTKLEARRRQQADQAARLARAEQVRREEAEKARAAREEEQKQREEREKKAGQDEEDEEDNEQRWREWELRRARLAGYNRSDDD